MDHSAFLLRLLNPDDLGHAVSPEVRQLARRVLGRQNANGGRRIYISGPMTGRPELNFPAFHAEAARLRSLGYDAVNPAELNPDPGASWHACMRVDLKALLDCEGLVLLDGWQQSDGAHLETHVAHRVGIDIHHPRDLAF